MKYLFRILLFVVASRAYCAELTLQFSSESGQALNDVAVYLLPVKGSAPKGSLTGIVDQSGKEFIPRVTVVQTGSQIRFPNRDNIRHHVYSISPAKPFELKLYSGTPSQPQLFDKAGLVVLGCNIHDWMVGYVMVADTPWFAVSDNEGKASITVPDGDYQLNVWHPDQKNEFTPEVLHIKDNVQRTIVHAVRNKTAAQRRDY